MEYEWVDNPRKEELHEALLTVRGTIADIPDVLSELHNAMEGGAWTGGTSEEFLGELADQETKATDAGDAAETTVQEAYNAEADQIKQYLEPALTPE